MGIMPLAGGNAAADSGGQEQVDYKPGGVLAMNLIGSLGTDNFMTASVVATLRTAFDTVELMPTFDPSRNATGEGNLIVVAYQGPHRAVTPRVLSPVHRLAADQVRANLGRRYRFAPGTPSIVLTDDYNPIDVYDAVTWSCITPLSVESVSKNGIPVDIPRFDRNS